MGHDQGPHNWLASRCIMRASGPRLSSKSGVRFKGDPLKVYRSAAGVATSPSLAVRVPVRALPSVWLTLNMDAWADCVVTTPWRNVTPLQDSLMLRHCHWRWRGFP